MDQSMEFLSTITQNSWKVQMMEIGQGYNQPPHRTHTQQEKTHGPQNLQIQ